MHFKGANSMQWKTWSYLVRGVTAYEERKCQSKSLKRSKDHDARGNLWAGQIYQRESDDETKSPEQAFSCPRNAVLAYLRSSEPALCDGIGERGVG
jgi:hypothetical protein